ncbi:hypothetical protein BTO05_00575 [Winogradskyella sp. PC-19]|nr:hypothetical protein BTO05_00575 [Winogradskyella sp. PC-19]
MYTSIVLLLLVIAPLNEVSSTFTLNCSNTEVDNVSSNVVSTIEVLDDTVVWTQFQTTEDIPSSFDIVSTSGSWDATNSTGQLSYILNQDGYQADFSVTGTNSGISAQFVFHISDTQQETYNFLVSSITY